MKLSERQWYVLNKAYRNYTSDIDDGAVTTRQSGQYSISSNTCKSLVKLGLLSETGYRDRFYLTPDGVRLVESKVQQPRKFADPQHAIEVWNAKVKGKR